MKRILIIDGVVFVERGPDDWVEVMPAEEFLALQNQERAFVIEWAILGDKVVPGPDTAQ